MQLSPSAQDLRDLANRLQQISEFETQTAADTHNAEHDITDGELARLKMALRPLVSGDMQSRFTQVLNKMITNQPITFAESKLITSAFISMADIIADDPSLIARLRKDIKDYNDKKGGDNSEGDEYSPDLEPEDFDTEEPTADFEEPTDDSGYNLK
jgi:hypothetical protein